MKRVIGLIFIHLIFLLGCSSNEANLLFTTFEDKWVAEDYEGLYQLLSSESQQLISQEEFVTKYTNIFSGMQASNLQLTMGEIDTENDTIPFSLTMETIAGPVSLSDYKLPYLKENKELKIIWSEKLIFPTMEAGDKVRVMSKSATRGSILDRTGQPLASDGTLRTVGIHPSIFEAENKEDKIMELARLLDISEEVIIKKLAANSNPDHFVPIVDLLPNSPLLTLLQNRNADGILVRNKNGRIYQNHEAFGRLLGYIGAITAEELQKDKENTYTSTSMIGKAGLEQVYEETLRGINGVEIYIERDGEAIETIALIEPKNGEDIQLSIDSTLQINVYETMNGEKGSATAIDPKTGEILALVSSPSYNSNLFTTYQTLSEQQRRQNIDYTDTENRFSKLYSPGSTFKLITAAIGLESGELDPDEIKIINGSEWQNDTSWGNYKVRRINSQSQISLKEAIKYSDNIYFAMAALQIGNQQLLQEAQKFTIGTPLSIGYPLKQSQLANNQTIASDILLADTGYGQGEIMVSTLNIALAYSVLSNNGNIMTPTLVLNETYMPTILKENVVSDQNLMVLQEAFQAVVEDSDGTGHLAKIENIRLAGKTGTAEIKQTQGEIGSQNGWFVATDLDTSNISIALVVEDVQNGLGTLGVTSMVHDILIDYLK